MLSHPNVVVIDAIRRAANALNNRNETKSPSALDLPWHRKSLYGAVWSATLTLPGLGKGNPSLANNQGIDWRITLKLHLCSESENDRALGTTSHVRVVLNYRLQKEHW
jgi:hypothetical protein